MPDNTASDDIKEQLLAIEKETEAATNAILDATEQNLELINQLRALAADQSESGPIVDKLDTLNQNLVQACAFQDITSQRLKIIEALLDPQGNSRPAEDSLENGPQLEGKGLSQSDIDALLD